jgi:pyruvate ferredoxin oxidoreductase delta subunit
MEEGAKIKHDIKKAPKTGDWRSITPSVDKAKCVGCGTCVSFCPEACVELKNFEKEEKKKADIDYDWCKGCGVCASICPVKAILMKKTREK